MTFGMALISFQVDSLSESAQYTSYESSTKLCKLLPLHTAALNVSYIFVYLTINSVTSLALDLLLLLICTLYMKSTYDIPVSAN